MANKLSKSTCNDMAGALDGLEEATIDVGNALGDADFELEQSGLDRNSLLVRLIESASTNPMELTQIHIRAIMEEFCRRGAPPEEEETMVTADVDNIMDNR